MSKRTTPIGQRRIVLILALVAAAFLLFFPMRQLIDQRGNIDTLEQRLNTLRTENRRLEREVQKLSDAGELEVEARERLALVKPGEKVYYIESGRAAEAPKATEEPPASWWSRTWDWMVDLIRGRD